MTEIRELLPIGSVVLLKGAQKRVMITGVKQTDAQNTANSRDYCGVLWPEGHIGDQYNFLFDQSDIERVDFRGFEDPERDSFLSRLDTYYRMKQQKK